MPNASGELCPFLFDTRAQRFVNDVRRCDKLKTDQVTPCFNGRSHMPHANIQGRDMSPGAQLHGVLGIHGERE